MLVANELFLDISMTTDFSCQQCHGVADRGERDKAWGLCPPGTGARYALSRKGHSGGNVLVQLHFALRHYSGPLFLGLFCGGVPIKSP